MQRVTIIGLGLMGGSIGLWLKKKRPSIPIVGYSRKKDTRDDAVGLKAIDNAANSIEEAVRYADLIIIATPIDQIVQTVKKIIPFTQPDSVITDIGSVKGSIVDALRDIPNFIGGHPMTGKETRGLPNASADIFEHCTWVLTPTPKTLGNKLKTLQSFLKQLDVNTVIMNASLHDAVVAEISHVPALIATILMQSATDAGNWERAEKLAAMGFRDTTRLAGSDPELTTAFCMHNRKNVLGSLERFDKQLKILKKLIEEGDTQKLKSYFSNIQKQRTAWFAKSRFGKTRLDK
ncbi:prephenate dehydrogenase/arogenate dehydrogenase family protein [Candidatus Roizmanbacteria bacterium]|nr:prephenate dehydrogenase/arogenate dehydrogenase family protein [Candidatus Roizmanbacteria bacterium]